jgi:hypothetical protein
MYYAPPPQPYAPAPPPTPQYSGCMKWGFYLLSAFIPIAGIIIAIVYMGKADPESKSLGKVCLIISIVVMVIGCCVGMIFGVIPAVLPMIQGYS